MVYKTNDLKVDTLLKEYFTDVYHFADMINVIVFDGRQIIHPDNVSNDDTSASTFYDAHGYPVTIERKHDVVKKVIIDQKPVLIAMKFRAGKMLVCFLDYESTMC